MDNSKEKELQDFIKFASSILDDDSIDWSKVDLSKATLADADLTGATLLGADLKKRENKQ